MIIIGIDPGLATTGYGILEVEGGRMRSVEYGCVTTDKSWPFARRLGSIYDQLQALFQRHAPQVVAVEELFFAKNAKTAIAVGQARGAAILAAQKFGASVAEYTPLEVKQAATGYGRADKNQVQQMIGKILSLPRVPRPDDAADALAIAYCCAVSMALKLKT